ncbi:MAG: DUF4382 domain-containing protein [Armatimonadota bacterium]
MRVFSLVAGLALTAMLLLGGCGGSSNNVQLLLGDAPLHLEDGVTVTEVNATITEVVLSGDESDGSPKVTLFSGSLAQNLLLLANTPLSGLPTVASVSVPPGTYHQLRLRVDPDTSTVVTNSGTYPLWVASSVLKVPIEVTIEAGVDAMLLLDFDLTKIHDQPSGDFKLTPNCVRLVNVAYSQSVTGALALPEGAAPTEDVVANISIHTPTDTTAIASTQVVLNTTTPSANFVLNGIFPGEYVVTVALTYGAQTTSFDSTQFTVTGGVAPAPLALTVQGLTFP